MIYAKYGIFFDDTDVDNPEDTAECLNGVLSEMIADDDFPDYLIAISDPEYEVDDTTNEGCSYVYLCTDDYYFTVYLEAVYEVDDDYGPGVNVSLCAGPSEAFVL